MPAGGAPLKTPIGTLYPPNLTPDAETGLGRWSDLDFVNAVQRGISPGRHAIYIPAFPYTSYAAMRTEDVLDIKAYLATLDSRCFAQARCRHSAGLHRAARHRPVEMGRPRYRAMAARSRADRKLESRLLSGQRPGPLRRMPHAAQLLHGPRQCQGLRRAGRIPRAYGKVPSLRDLVGRGRYKDAKDLASALQFGETLGYDKISSGGMGEVQTNMSKLPETTSRRSPNIW